MTNVTLHLGDCLDVMRGMPDGCVDAVVTDPPYGLAFMGKEWDHGVPGVAFWVEALRVAKPGAHLLAFGGTRTYHRLACAIEDAGWRVVDCLSWLYGSGFPKHKSLLKPAWEPVVMAAKAGRRVVNVDACRLATKENTARPISYAGSAIYAQDKWTKAMGRGGGGHSLGRWPANVCLDEEAAAVLDRMTGHLKGGVSVNRNRDAAAIKPASVYGQFRCDTEDVSYGDSRFFYVAKASRSEREAGLDGFEPIVRNITSGHGLGPINTSKGEGCGVRENRPSRNHHPTVKPVALMRWLVRLVTPPDGLVLDPFTGSGTTALACIAEGRAFVGAEKEPEYHAIAEARIAHARGEVRPDAEQPGLDFGVSA